MAKKIVILNVVNDQIVNKEISCIADMTKFLAAYLGKENPSKEPKNEINQ